MSSRLPHIAALLAMALLGIVCSSVASPNIGKTPANSEVQFPVRYAPTEVIVDTAAAISTPPANRASRHLLAVSAALLIAATVTASLDTHSSRAVVGDPQ